MIKSENRANLDERLIYDGKSIRRRGDLLNLESMWHATGRDPHCRPRDWFAAPETKRLLMQLRNTSPATSAAMLTDIAGLSYIRKIDADFLVVIIRGRKRGTWAHIQIALAYAQYLSPSFSVWCHEVIRDSLERPGDPSASPLAPVRERLEHQFDDLHQRFDIIDRHAADLLYLVSAAQELVLGNRRPFSERSQLIIREVVAMRPYAGRCPCCNTSSVLSPNGKPAIWAQYDHFFHRGLNRPELGWLICRPCHQDLTRGGYLKRFSKVAQFRAFQAAVLALIQAQYRSK